MLQEVKYDYTVLFCIKCGYEPKKLITVGLIMDLLLWGWSAYTLFSSFYSLYATPTVFTYKLNKVPQVIKVNYILFHLGTFVDITYGLIVIWPTLKGFMLLISVEKFRAEYSLSQNTEAYVSARKLGLIAFALGSFLNFICYEILVYVATPDMLTLIIFGVFSAIGYTFMIILSLIFACMWWINNNVFIEAAKGLEASSGLKNPMEAKEVF